jgi:hypothetical protein
MLDEKKSYLSEMNDMLEEKVKEMNFIVYCTDKS